MSRRGLVRLVYLRRYHTLHVGQWISSRTEVTYAAFLDGWGVASGERRPLPAACSRSQSPTAWAGTIASTAPARFRVEVDCIDGGERTQPSRTTSSQSARLPHAGGLFRLEQIVDGDHDIEPPGGVRILAQYSEPVAQPSKATPSTAPTPTAPSASARCSTLSARAEMPSLPARSSDS